MIINGLEIVQSRMYGYDSTLLAWVPSPPFSAGAASTAASSTNISATISGNSTVVQGTNPWVIGGNSSVWQGSSAWQVQVTSAPTLTIQGNSTVFQGSTNWQVQVVNTPSVTAAISGNSSVWQGSSAWQVQVTSSPRINIGSTAADNVVRALLSSTSADNPVVISGNSTAVIQGNCTVVITSAPAGWALAGFGNKSGQLSSSADNTLVSSVTGKAIFVYGWTLSPLSTVANLIRWLDGSTTEIWRARVQGGSTATANFVTSELAVSPPGYLMKTSIGNALLMNATSSGVNFGVAYWQA